jgi:hypothetical protein
LADCWGGATRQISQEPGPASGCTRAAPDPYDAHDDANYRWPKSESAEDAGPYRIGIWIRPEANFCSDDDKEQGPRSKHEQNDTDFCPARLEVSGHALLSSRPHRPSLSRLGAGDYLTCACSALTTVSIFCTRASACCAAALSPASIWGLDSCHLLSSAVPRYDLHWHQDNMMHQPCSVVCSHSALRKGLPLPALQFNRLNGPPSMIISPSSAEGSLSPYAGPPKVLGSGLTAASPPIESNALGRGEPVDWLGP